MLLVADNQHRDCAERNDAASLRIVPNTLQLFEYESVFFDCEGFNRFTEWRVMRRIMGTVTTCGPVRETSNGPCRINHSFSTDSGEYWCEAKGIGRSSSVNISVSNPPSLHEETRPPHHSPVPFILRFIVIMFAVAALSLVSGLFHCGKHRDVNAEITVW
ncbi:low affinity immunoglobulin gamma Fc region receptor II-like protein [Lates japonicus]|nr:low affinity immunoglobulin gamma Fc region receptor II-like protein [Lates japonicus]